MSSGNDDDDWGLLSVADIIDSVVPTDDHESDGSTDLSFTASDEASVPSFLLEAPLAESLQGSLLSGVKKRLYAHSTRIERVFEVRFRKVKLSLSSSKKIRDRLSEAIVSMGTSLLAQEEHTSLLSTIALLGAITDCDEKGIYTSVLLDSAAHVNWNLASPQSCLELFRIIEAHASEDELSDQLRVAVAHTKLGLALRSGCLSLLLKCLVAPSALLTLNPAVFPPESSSPCVRVSMATMSDFLVKTLVLPAQFRAKDPLRCSAHDCTFLLLGDTHIACYEALGTMGTRLIQRSVQQLPGQRGDVVLYPSEGVSLCIRALGRDEHFRHFSVRREGVGGETHGRLTLRTAGLSLADVRFHFCVTGTDTLCCLVSSHPPHRTRGCLYVGDASLEALLGSASTIELAPLFRNPSFNAVSRRRAAFHFTKSISVAAGRVTLKDRFHPFCIEMWVFPRSVAKDQIFLSIGDKSVDEVLLGLEPVGDGVRWRGGARTPRLGPSFAMYNSAGKLSVLERWWHVALNFNGAAWELWLDHELVGRQQALVSPNAIANAKCVVGKNFIGLAAEVRVWQHTRTAAELARDARRPLLGNEDGLCAYFPLDEGYGNVIMDYAPPHEHALLPYGEPYWCAVDSFPVIWDSLDSRQVLDFVPQAWIEEADEVFFAASQESYTIAGVRSDHTLCVFDYARDRRCLVAQRSVELPVSWCVKGISSDHVRKSLCCCAVAMPLSGSAACATTSSALQVFLWEMWAYAGHREAAPHAPYETSWQCGKAVLERSAAHAQRILRAVQYLTDQSTWASVVPPFVLDPDDDVLALLLRVAQQASSAPTSQLDLDLVQYTCTLLQVNLLARLYSSPLDFALRVGRCYDSVEQLLRAATEGEETDRSVATTPALHLRESIIRFALRCSYLDAPSSSELLRSCCQCFLTENSRLFFLERQSGKPRAPAAETVYCCLLTLYSSLHTCCDMLSSQPANQLSSLFSALYLEAMYQMDRSLRVKSVDGLLRTSHCLEVFAEVLLSGCGMDGDSARLEALQCAYSTALLRCCEKMVDAVSKALRQVPEAEATFLKCLQLSPIGALLASFAVSLPLLPTSALAACSTSLQKCRESLLVLMDRFPGEEAKHWASRLCVTLTYSLAQLGCTLLNPFPSSEDAVPALAVAGSSTAPGESKTSETSSRPPYMSVLRNGQRRLNTERDALIKNLQGSVGVLSRVFEELQTKDVSALRVVRDEQLRETERQVMAACCALLLPTQALRDATPESLLPAFQLVLKLRPWCLSKRQESKEYVAKMRERAVFLALFEPIAEVGDDEVGMGKAGMTSSSSSSRARTSSTSNSYAAQVTQRQKWRRLFKSWKAMRQLKALMSSREEAADLNVGAEIIACFQSEVSTSEMESAVAWRSKKAQYRLVGLQLLWQLTEEARHSALLARVLHPVIARTLCGWHYADGVDGCSVEQLTRLQSAFFLLLEAAVKAYEEVGKQAQPWVLLLAALFSCPFRRTDLRKLRTTSVSADVMRRLWTTDTSPEFLYERVNGSLPWALRATKLSPVGCASTITVGAAGLTLRSSGGRGSCVAPCTWTKSVRKEAASYYYEVYVIDLYQGGYVSVGLGPADYSLSQMPGWDPDSFAYDGLEGAVYTNRNARVIGSTFGMGDVVGCGWDREAGEIFWTRNGKSVHSVKALMTSEELRPLIGMKGKGCVQVNFGARPFVYQNWPVRALKDSSRVLSPTELASGARHMGPRLESEVSWDGWDAFRLLSMRAAKLISEAASQVSFIVPTSLPELAETVGRCLDALVCALAPSAEASLSQLPLPARYVTTLLGHLTLLCKLLRGVPEDVIAIHTSRVAVLLAKMATRWLLTTSRVVLFSAEESETVTALLMAWYYTMYLTPPTVVHVASPTGNPKKVDATTTNTPSSRATRSETSSTATAWTSLPSMPNFLHVLIQLASCIITTDDTRMSASETRHVLESNANVSVVTSCDTAHWLALSLLQHLNNDCDQRSHHAWRKELQVWLQHTLKAGSQISEGDQVKNGGEKTSKRDILLGLAILGGIPRLAVPGDTVMAHLSTHTIAPVLLLNASWSEEICEVLEVHAGDASKAAVKTSTTTQPAMATHVIKRLPLRFVHATLRGNDPPNDTFPIKGDTAHLELAEAVAQLAQMWFLTVTPATQSTEDACLVAQLSCVLVHCAERNAISVSPQLIDSLSVLTGMVDNASSSIDQVRLELVLSLWGLLQCRQRRGLLRNSLSAIRMDREGWTGSEEREQLGSQENAGCTLVRIGHSVSSPTVSSSMRLQTFAALDPLHHHLLGHAPDEPDMAYEEEDDENSDPEEDDDSEFGTRSPYPLHGMDDADEDGGADEEEAEPSRLATAALAQTQSRLSASSTPDVLFFPTEREMFDTIHFNGGCVRLVASAPVGLSFTVDLSLRMTNIENHQILFAQMLRGGPSSTALEMVARITRGNLEFGWLPCFPGGEAELDPADPAMICSFALSEADLNTWIRVTFVQSGTTLSLFRGGLLLDSRSMKTGGGSLLQEELRIGGIPQQLGSTSFVGDIKNFRVYELALRPAMVEQLRRLNSSLSMFLESHVALLLKTTRTGVENAAKTVILAVLDVWTEGDVGYLDESEEAAARHIQVREACVQELDFGTESEETDFRVLNEPLPSQQSVLWNKKRSQFREQLLSICTNCYQQLAAFYSAHILVHTAHRVVKSSDDLSESDQHTMEVLKDDACVARLADWAVSTSGKDMTTLLNEMWLSLCSVTSGGTEDNVKVKGMWEIGNALLAELLRIAQRPPHARIFESAHPQRPFASNVYEVQVPGQRSYAVFVDERSVASWRLVTVSADRTLSAMLSEFCSTALASFEVCLPQFFLTVRSAAESSNWGHRITVVHDYQPQLQAMRLFRSALSAFLTLDSPPSSAMAYVWSVECLMALRTVAQRNTSKTRLLALTCLNHLLLFNQRFRAAPPPLSLPLLLHDMRRMALRHYRRRLPTQRVLGRFIQVSMESYVMKRDAAQCWQGTRTPLAPECTQPSMGSGAGDRTTAERAPPPTDASAEESAAAAHFSRHRREQMQLYRQRDTAAERVSIQKVLNPQSLSLEWSGDGVCILRRSDSTGGSVVAGVPLTAGRWYYELRIGGTGDISVGVLPIPSSVFADQGPPPPLTSTSMQEREPVTFNGCTGVFHCGERQQLPLQQRPLNTPLWFNRDYLGIVIDIPAQLCTILVNGVQAVSFTFGPEAALSEGAAAALPPSSSTMPAVHNSGEDMHTFNGAEGRHESSHISFSNHHSSHRSAAQNSAPVAYYPYVSVGQADSVSLNFGAAYFEHEVPCGCLPLDPANLSLGTMFPYNQMRALQDLAAHLLTGGRYPLPPFYYEEADPFAGSTERVGPAHVSVQTSANVQVNMEDVKNTGLDFETVTGDCAVGAGSWYFEVTLRTQGLMQIGWMQKGEAPHGNGHGVGDSSTSWSVDLFRRVMWHRGVPEPVNIPRRWAAGDVVGCAVDMAHGELSFFLNGRPITGISALESESPLTETCTFHGIPQGFYYVPAVSLRSGGAVSFNFGSTPFKYKPEGFNPLGVPDSWNERMDTFYNNASASSTQQRMAVMQEAWRVLRSVHPAMGASATAAVIVGRAPLGPRDPANAQKLAAQSWSMDDFEKNLVPYRLVVHAIDNFSNDATKSLTKNAEEELAHYLANFAYPDSGSGGVSAAAVAERSWDFFKVLKAVSKIVHALLPFLSLNTTHPTLMTLLFLSLRTLLFRAVRRKLIENVLTVSSVRSEQYRICINRAKAHAERQSVKSSVFGQTFALLGSQSSRIFQTHQRFWNTVFLGEGAEDAGGPFREHLSEMCRELMSGCLPFFVPTANHVHNTGSHRETYVPAASARSAYDLEAFAFIGKLMGGALRSENPLDLFFPPLVWRYLCAYPITETEVEQVDVICVQCIREFRVLGATNAGVTGTDGDEAGGTETELFEDVFGEEFFVTQLSDHSTKELIEGGSQTRVTLERSGEYAEALLQARLHEFDVQLHKMREGLLSVVPEVAVLLLTPEELELRVCGQADYTPEELRKGASYEGLTSEDRRVQFLWKALEEATPLQRRLFLRFVSGRDRMPVKLRILPLTTQADADTVLPRAATCFFAIEVPDYSTLEVMKRKLYYSIENCADMDTDFNARVVDEDEGPQLSVGLDDGQQDTILPNSEEE
ncbi:ubiquitin-protein ligase, putative [Leishmania tarentolae]|uniref:Ubiquitin-protein ligase, putative n=1 Tax=Leishmania tarentolae TaxID=5689 RepID=A0A640KX54_LEITA|nr:ubiquitin-protein ligase, putative [Leishmania tarentolae]